MRALDLCRGAERAHQLLKARPARLAGILVDGHLSSPGRSRQRAQALGTLATSFSRRSFRTGLLATRPCGPPLGRLCKRPASGCADAQLAGRIGCSRCSSWQRDPVAYSAARSSITGESMRQGPHQGAQKSPRRRPCVQHVAVIGGVADVPEYLRSCDDPPATPCYANMYGATRRGSPPIDSHCAPEVSYTPLRYAHNSTMSAACQAACQAVDHPPGRAHRGAAR